MCVKAFCDISTNSFADQDLKKCVLSCDYPKWADNSTRMCVEQCPSVPLLFGRVIDRVCVEECPPGTYADNITN